jgi:hypothetical protein
MTAMDVNQLYPEQAPAPSAEEIRRAMIQLQGARIHLLKLEIIRRRRTPKK